jgi:hypothetical protein
LGHTGRPKTLVSVGIERINKYLGERRAYDCAKSVRQVRFGTWQLKSGTAQRLAVREVARSTQFQDLSNRIIGLLALSVLQRLPCKNGVMPRCHWNRKFLRTISLGSVSLATCFLAGSLILSADTPKELRTATVGTCYCHCAEARARRSCVKMCEAPKYAATRPWSTTCLKPRLKLPAENRDAGPRFEHPGRSEKAQLSPANSSRAAV